MHRLQELVRLHRLGLKCREVRRLLRMGTNTERKYRRALQAEGLLEGDPADLPSLSELQQAVVKHFPVPPPPPQCASSVEPWAEEIAELVDKGAGATAIYDRLRLKYRDEFSASLSAVKRKVRSLKKNRSPGPNEVAIPVETPPGYVAQVDFGSFGYVLDPRTGLPRKAWVFVMVLAHSRHMYAKVVFDQKVATWLQAHVDAFAWFGGCPKVVVPDNLKAAIVRAAFGTDDTAEVNRAYRELVRYYGIVIDPTPPHAPNKKGKVESAVKYIKNNFRATRGLMPANRLQAELEQWLIEVAGKRIHGTTHKRPLELFEQSERQALAALPDKPYDIVVWKTAKVHPDCHISFDNRLYSVPFQLVGSTVWVRANSHTVEIYADNELVASHRRHGSHWRETNPAHLPSHRAERRHRTREYWLERAGRIDPEVADFARHIFEADNAVLRIRPVQALVLHLETFPRHRAVAACRRASFFGAYSFQAVKAILRHGLDLLPLPSDQDPLADDLLLASPTFARSPAELVRRHLTPGG